MTIILKGFTTVTKYKTFNFYKPWNEAYCKLKKLSTKHFELTKTYLETFNKRFQILLQDKMQ